MAMLSSRRVAAPAKASAIRRSRVMPVVRAAAASSEVPDMNKRNIMNLILAGGAGLPITTLALGYGAFFVPPRCAAQHCMHVYHLRLRLERLSRIKERSTSSRGKRMWIRLAPQNGRARVGPRDQPSRADP